MQPDSRDDQKAGAAPDVAQRHRPWLTIVTVIKDDPEGLRRTISSLLDQNLDDVDYVIVDSSLDPDEVPESVKKSEIRSRCSSVRIEHVPARGIYTAMNLGLSLANGRFIYFLNAGDEFASSHVLRTAHVVVTQEDATWLYGATEIVGLDGVTTQTPEWDYQLEKAAGFSRGFFPGHQSTLMSTDLLTSFGGFDTNYQLVADYDAFLQASRVSDPIELDLCVGRFHEGGASSRHWARAIWEFHRARRRRLDLSGTAALRERVATSRQLLAMATYRSPWPLGALMSLLVWLMMVALGVPAMTAGLLVLFTGVQAVGGGLWWRLAQPHRSVSVLESIGVGLALGTAGAMLTGLVGAWWAVALGAVPVWLLRRRTALLAPQRPLSKPELAAVLAGLIPGIAAFLWAVRSYPLTWSGLWSGYHGDMPFFEALANSVARLGPGASIFMDGAQLRYHSLAYGWAGQLTLATDAEPFVVLTRLLPLVMLIGAIALAAAWVRTLTSTAWAPSLAVLLIVTGGFLGATFGGVLNFDSPSQSVGALWLLGLSIAFLRVLDLQRSWRWLLLPVVVLSVALTGGKVSSAAIGGIGIGAVALLSLARRERWWPRALAVAAVAGLSMVAAYLWLLAGSANAGGLNAFTLLDRAASVQGLNPVITTRGIIAGVVLLGLAILPRWAGLAWLVVDPSARWKPETVYGLGLAGGAMVALGLLSGGFNDLWFAVAASAPLAVLSAFGVAQAVKSLDNSVRHRVWIAVALGLAIALVVAALWTTGSTGVLGNGWRWTGPLVGGTLVVLVSLFLAWGSGKHWKRTTVTFSVVVLVSASLPSKLLYGFAAPLAPQQEGSMSTVLFRLQPDYIETLDRQQVVGWTGTQAAAGLWLRENSDAGDLVATNVTLSGLVPALTHRTTYISDIHMQAPYGLASDATEIQRREAESWAFINKPSPATLAPLCSAGVRWVWVDPQRATNNGWQPYARVAEGYPDVTILEINSSACR